MIETLTPVILSAGRGTVPPFPVQPANAAYYAIGSPLVQTQAVTGFSQTNRYYTPDGTGPILNTTQFSYWLVTIPPRNQTTNNGQIPFGKTSATPGSHQRGWGIWMFQGCFHGMVDQGTYDIAYSLSEKYAQGSNISWTEITQIAVFHIVFRGNVQYTYKNGRLIGKEGSAGPGLAKTGITNPQPPWGVSIGSAGGLGVNSQPYDGSIISCGVSSATGLSDAQVLAHYNALLSNPYAAATGATHLWKASDAGATWTDSISGLVATRFGSPTVININAPFYPAYDITTPFGATAPVYPQRVGTIRVFGIGDSRTFQEGSWRTLCDYGKVAAGMDIAWVGVSGGTNYGYIDHNSGIPGNSTPGQVTGVGATPSFASELVTRDPHVIVMWYGQNAGDSSQATYEAERVAFIQLLDMAYAYRSDMRILIFSEMTGMRSSAVAGAGLAAKFWDYDNWKQQIVLQYKAAGKMIDYCRITQTIFWDNGSDYFDTIHPLAVPTGTPTANVGYNKIGGVAWPSLRYICGYN